MGSRTEADQLEPPAALAKPAPLKSKTVKSAAKTPAVRKAGKKSKSRDSNGSHAKRVSSIPENFFNETASGVAESSGTVADQPEPAPLKSKTAKSAANTAAVTKAGKKSQSRDGN